MQAPPTGPSITSIVTEAGKDADAEPVTLPAFLSIRRDSKADLRKDAIRPPSPDDPGVVDEIDEVTGERRSAL
jgi:hypothetical protein